MIVPFIFLIHFRGTDIYLLIIVATFVVGCWPFILIVNKTITIQGASIFISAVASVILPIIIYLFSNMLVVKFLDKVRAIITNLKKVCSLKLIFLSIFFINWKNVFSLFILNVLV